MKRVSGADFSGRQHWNALSQCWKVHLSLLMCAARTLLWCALSYHLLLKREIVGFNRRPLSSWDVTPFQRLYIAMRSGISEILWGTSDDLLELILDREEESSSSSSALLLVCFWVWGSSRIAFFLKRPHKHQAASNSAFPWHALRQVTTGLVSYVTQRDVVW